MKKLTIICCIALSFIMSFSFMIACNVPKGGMEEKGEKLLEAKGDEPIVTMQVEVGNFIEFPGLFYDAVKDYEANTTWTQEHDDAESNYYITKRAWNYNLEHNGIRLKGKNDGFNNTNAMAQYWAAGSGPDIFVGETAMPSFAEEGRFYAMPDEYADEVRELCIGSAYKPFEIDGKIYGVAINTSPIVLVWDKNVIRKTLGNDSKYVNEAPKTYAEMLEVAAAIKAADSRYQIGGPYMGDNYGGALRSAPFAFQAGGTLVDERGKPKFNDPKSIQGWQFIRDLAGYSSDGLLTASEGSAYDGIKAGRQAYAIDASWQYSYMLEEEVDAGIGQVPTPTGAAGEAVASYVGSVYFGVPKYNKNSNELTVEAENAMKVLLSLIQDPIQEMVGEKSPRPTINKHIGESEGYKKSSSYQAYTIMRDATRHEYLPSFLDVAFDALWRGYFDALKKTATKVNGSYADLNTIWNDANSVANNA